MKRHLLTFGIAWLVGFTAAYGWIRFVEFLDFLEDWELNR